MGLWSRCQYPNYAGEMLVWSSVFALAAPGLSGATAALAAVSPIFVSGLLLGVSGVPLAEKQSWARYGKDPAFVAYKERTPLLVPKLF